jgi:pyrimidine operon attenuation protein/uracil phosphoribosyltransferase
VLIDRGGRELPIRADYTIKAETVGPSEHIDVVADEAGISATVRAKHGKDSP